MSPEQVWYGKGSGAALARAALLPASGLYWLAWRSYELVYKLGLKRARRPHWPIVCVGNLTVGGSGKTPATMAVAGLLKAAGKKVVLGMSGYGSPASASAQVAPEGPLEAHQWGDEPAMVRWLLPDLPIIVGRDRVMAAELCASQFPDAILLMDDGLQHKPLAKDVRICIDDGAARWVLPAGPYREPRSNLSSMDLVVGAGGQFALEYGPNQLIDPETGKRCAPPEGSVLTAIARPHRLVESLGQAGLTVVNAKLLPDHDPLCAGNLFGDLPDHLPVVVTAKDWVKLQLRSDLDRTILIARREARIVPEEPFAHWLMQRLNEIKHP